MADAEGKLADAVNALNSQLIPTALTSATDFNTLTGAPAGKTTLYSGANISQMTNIPSYFSGQSWPFILETRKISQYTQQILHVYSSTGNPVDTWIRNQSYINGAVGWLGWEQIIVTSQMDKYKGRVRLTANNTTYNVDLTNFGDYNTSQFQGFLIVSRYGVWYAIHTVSGSTHEGTIQTLFNYYDTTATIAYSTDGKTMTLTFSRTMYGGITVLG